MPRFRVENSERVLDFLKSRLSGWKTATLKRRLRDGLVQRGGAPILSGAEWVRAGETIEVLPVPAPASRLFPAELGEAPLAILYGDDDLIAVDKPSGLLSVASERERNLTAIRLMREWLQSGGDRRGGRDLHAAHRLDREASGVLLLARSLETKRKLASAWSEYEKVYLAVVDGLPPEPEGTITVPLWEDKGLFVRAATSGRGEEAVTWYSLLKKKGRRALLEIRLGTGRKHQIRAHLNHIGCPIVGDLRYGVSKASRLALHAHRLRVKQPTTGEWLEIRSPIPDEFKRMLSGRR